MTGVPPPPVTIDERVPPQGAPIPLDTAIPKCLLTKGAPYPRVPPPKGAHHNQVSHPCCTPYTSVPPPRGSSHSTVQLTLKGGPPHPMVPRNEQSTLQVSPPLHGAPHTQVSPSPKGIPHHPRVPHTQGYPYPRMPPNRRAPSLTVVEPLHLDLAELQGWGHGDREGAARDLVTPVGDSHGQGTLWGCDNGGGVSMGIGSVVCPMGMAGQ